MIHPANNYFLFFMAHLSLMFFVYPEKVLDYTSQGHWFAILLTWLIGALMLMIFIKALNVFPGKILPEIMLEIMGKWVSRLIMLPLLLYWLDSAILINRAYAEMIGILLLERTPTAAILLLLIVPVLLMIAKIDGHLATAWLITLVSMPVIVFTLAAPLIQVEWHNVVPLKPNLHFLRDIDYYVSLFVVSPFLLIGFYTGHHGGNFRVYYWVCPSFLFSWHQPIFLCSHLDRKRLLSSSFL